MELYNEVKEKLREKQPKIYSADLVNILFSYPIVTPTTLAEKLGVHRRTAARYLEELRKNEFLTDQMAGRHHLYSAWPKTPKFFLILKKSVFFGFLFLVIQASWR